MLVLVAVVAVVATRYLMAPASNAPPVRATIVGPGTVERTIRLSGSTAPVRSAYLRAPNLRGIRGADGGRDFSLTLTTLAPSGLRVRQGDIVATFDPLHMRNRLDDWQAARVERVAGMAGLVEQLRVARHAHELSIRRVMGNMDKAMLDLKSAPVRSKMQVERFRLAYEEAAAAYKSLMEQSRFLDISQATSRRMEQIKLDEAALEEKRAESNLDRMVIRSPIDGMLLMTTLFRGGDFTEIAAGDTLGPGQFFVRVADTTAIVVEAEANQTDLRNLKLGAPAVVRFDAFAGLELPATVDAIHPAAVGRGLRRDFVRVVPV
ncbi:MAG: efflux RND transporter periplasmic adaptor subunit, partial [Bryobacteraceae bacterium]